ncbi:MAG: tripartite tricarboxylate transporter TctB family protein [Pseudomonadota bacterium]
MQTADRAIAIAIMGASVYFMAYAVELPIGWHAETGGPGGGAFPFWLSLIMCLCALGILVRSFMRPVSGSLPYFDRVMLRSVILVTLSLICAVALIPFAGAYVSIALFLLWYLRIFGGHGWPLTLILTITTPVFLFFFFEVTLKILLPKGWTEPFFLPLYALFF